MGKFILPATFVLLHFLFTAVKAQGPTRTRVVKTEIASVQTEPVNESVAVTFLKLKDSREEYHFTIYSRKPYNYIFYVERMDGRGRTAYARSPYVLLQLQEKGQETTPLNSLNSPQKPYILRFVNDSLSIFQEDIETLEKMFRFLDTNMYILTPERKREVNLQELRREMLFDCPDNWFWFDGKEIAFTRGFKARVFIL